MLPDNNIKELLSFRYIEAIANYCGYTTDKPDLDFGVDLYINEISQINIQNELKTIPTGRKLDLQIKSTTVSGIDLVGDTIKYPLRIKNFNDLIFRKTNYNNILLLILFVLPNDKHDWIKINDKELIIRKCAYWYFPENENEVSDNVSSKTIEIKKSNLITIENFNELFNQFA